MNKQRSLFRIVLKRHTLRQLSTSELQHAIGGNGSDSYDSNPNLAAETGGGNCTSETSAFECRTR